MGNGVQQQWHIMVRVRQRGIFCTWQVVADEVHDRWLVGGWWSFLVVFESSVLFLSFSGPLIDADPAIPIYLGGNDCFLCWRVLGGTLLD